MTEAVRSFQEEQPNRVQSPAIEDTASDNVVYLFPQLPQHSEIDTDTAATVAEATEPVANPGPNGEYLLTPRIMRRSKIAAAAGAVIGLVPGFIELSTKTEGVGFVFMRYTFLGTVIGGVGSIGLRYLDLRFPVLCDEDE